MNSLAFTGRLTANAELRTTKTGTELASFTVANNVGFGDFEKVNWIKCSLWGKRAKSLSPYLVKGLQVGIVGEVTLNTYETKAGESKSEMQVNVNDITLLGSASDKKKQQEAEDEQMELAF